MPCSNAAKTRNQLKFAGVPQTGQPISAASTPKFTVLWGHVEDILLLNKFFPIVDMCLSCEDIPRQSCAMVPRCRFLATQKSLSNNIIKCTWRTIFTSCYAYFVSIRESKQASAAWMTDMMVVLSIRWSVDPIGFYAVQYKLQRLNADRPVTVV